MMALFSGIWSKVAGYAVAIGGVLAVLAAAYAKGRASGVNAERTKQAQAETKAMKEAREIEEAIAGNAPDENRKELGKWAK